MIIRKFKQLKERFAPKDSFKDNVFTLMSGTGLAQLVPFFVAPIITRLYSPADFGLFAILIAVISILSVIASGRFEFAITIAKTDYEAIHILFLTIFMTLSLSIILLIMLFIFGNQISMLSNLVFLRETLYLIPLGIFLTGFYQAINFWMIRKKMFRRMALRRIIQFSSMAVLQIIFGFMALGPTGLILGYVLGQVVGYGFLAWQIWRENATEILRISLSESIKQAFRYKDFLFYSVPASLCSTMTSESPSFLLKYFFNSTVVGFYDLPRRLLSAPTALISSSILNVFQERASRDFKNLGNCKYIYIKTLKTLTLLAIVPYLLLFIFSPSLVPIIFGSEWQISGEYARYLSISSFMIFIASPLGFVLLIAEKQFINLIWQVSFLLVTIIALWIGAYLHSPSISIISFSLANSVMCVFYIILSYYFSSKKVKTHG